MSAIGIQTVRDDLSPLFKVALKKVKSPKLMVAVGVGLVSITKRAFNQAALRPAPWPNKKDGSPARLKTREASLWRSVQVKSATPSKVVIGSDKIYAAIHQLGGVIKPKHGKFLVWRDSLGLHFAKQVTIPARPYFPFDPQGKMTDAAALQTGRIIVAQLKL